MFLFCVYLLSHNINMLIITIPKVKQRLMVISLVLRAFNHELKYLANENVDLRMTLDEKSEDRQSYYNSS